MVWTEEKIRNLIASNNKMVENSLLVLFSRQTVTEQQAELTGESNGMGFNMIDAEFLSSLAKFIQKSRYPEGRRLTVKQRGFARKRLMKYVKQLTAFANARQEIKVQQALGLDNYSGELFRAGGTFNDEKKKK